MYECKVFRHANFSETMCESVGRALVTAFEAIQRRGALAGEKDTNISY